MQRWYANRADASGEHNTSRQLLLCPFHLNYAGSYLTRSKNRMTFEKQQRDAKKKRKAEEKRAMKQKKKELTASPQIADVEVLPVDESIEN